MNAFALAAAVVLAQAPAGPGTATAERPTSAPAAAPASPPEARTRAPGPEAGAEAAPAPAMVTTTARRRRAPALQPELASSTAAASVPPGSARPERSGAAGAPAGRPLPEREDAARAARAFLEALSRGDAAGLADASSDRFSFDGDQQSGREAIRRTWRDLLAARPPGAATGAVDVLEILPAQDAAERFGKPPIRLAPLVRAGVLVAVGDVGGRKVMVFVAREGGRMAVVGLHD